MENHGKNTKYLTAVQISTDLWIIFTQKKYLLRKRIWNINSGRSVLPCDKNSGHFNSRWLGNYLHQDLQYFDHFYLLNQISPGRWIRKTKAYICIFVCFATKPYMHLEPVRDFSSNAFLSSFKRFFGRCMQPHKNLIAFDN